MLIGEYHHNIDEKGRLIIPSKFREEIGKEFIITRGLDGCLFVYSLGQWNKIVSKLQTLPFTKKDARTFINYANIQKECTIIGVNDRLEVWASDKFDTLIEDNLTAIDEVAENLFEGFDIDA